MMMMMNKSEICGVHSGDNLYCGLLDYDTM